MRVDFDIAKMLKIKGFDVKCKEFYLPNGISNDLNYDRPFYNGNHEFEDWFKNWNEEYEDRISRPELTQVVDWLLAKHNIWIEVRRTTHFNNEIRFQSYINEKPLTGDMGGYVSHLTPQQAYSDAITYCVIDIFNGQDVVLICT